MERSQVITLIICSFLLMNFGLLQAKTRIVMPPDSTDIIVCTTDNNGVTVCI